MFDSIISGGITIGPFFICTAVSLALGVLTALVFMYKTPHSASLALTLSLLPAAVQLVIMLVNGNLGAGVAVAGAFSLVRFRSMPGSAKEIAAIFIAMALGLASGMGYVAIAGAFFTVTALFVLLLTRLNFGGGSGEKELKITIPENLDYEGLFDDIFSKYTLGWQLDRVKTTNMGTLYELAYHVSLRGGTIKKEFLDELRCRNGNLNIVCGRVTDKNQL